jgi:hypothetical protein
MFGLWLFSRFTPPLNLGVTFDENFNFKQHIYRKHVVAVFAISAIFAVFAGLEHFPLLKLSQQL